MSHEYCDGKTLRDPHLKTVFGVEGMTCPMCNPPIIGVDKRDYFSQKFELVVRLGDTEVVLASSTLDAANIDKVYANAYFGIAAEDELLSLIAFMLSNHESAVENNWGTRLRRALLVLQHAWNGRVGRANI